MPMHTIWGSAIVFGLLMLWTEPTLSDDVFRYLWDGHLVTEGVNPYSHPISATEYDPYETGVRRLANNPHLGSPYLPAAQLLFGTVASLLPLKALSMQITMMLFDLGTAAIIVRLLQRTGFASHRVALYLWHPLVVIELSHGAHLDAAMTFLALGATATAITWPSESGQRLPDNGRYRPWMVWASPVLLALAVMTRPLPALIIPVLWWRWSWGQRFLFGAACIGLLTPFSFGAGGLGLATPSTGTGLFGSARVYAAEFRFNGGIGHWLSKVFGHDSTIPTLATAVAMVSVGGVVWWVAKRQSNEVDHLRLAAVPLMAYTLLTPVFHPWYLVILLGFLPFLSPRTGESEWRWIQLAPWFIFSALVPLSYLTYENPDRFAEREWVRLIEWVPTIGLVVGVGLLSARMSLSARPSQLASGAQRE